MFIVTEFDLHSIIPAEAHDKLTESAAKIAMDNFEWGYTTLMLFNSTVVSGVDLFLRLYKKTQIVGRGKFFPSFAQRTKQCIVFGTDLSNIEQMLHWARSHQFDNTGNYIITCQSEDCDENKAVEIFWNHKMTSVVFLKLLASKEVAGYTYFYPDDKCRHSKPIRIKVCERNVSCYGMFPRKLKNLRSCPITVSTFIQDPYMNITDGKPSGADGDLLLLIVEGLNASLKMMTPRIGDGWGKLEANGTWAGSLADLLDDTANFSMTSPALTISRFSDFQMSVPYYTVSVAWVTHAAQMKPGSLKLFNPFETLSQIVLAVSFIFVGLCAWFVNSQYWPFYHKSNISKTHHGIFFYSWMICMGLPSTKLPTKPAFMYIALVWIWYCFLIRTFYQVCLINSLQGNFYYDDLDTIEEAFYRNYSFGGGLALREYFLENPLVYNSWSTVDTNKIIPTLKNLTHLKFVLAMNMQTAKNTIKKYNLFVHILREKVITSPTAIMFNKFSPLADSVNIILWRLIEGGFTEKMYSKYASKTKSQNEDSHTPITLEHYTGCYVILFIGWVVSTALFVVEIFYSKMQRIKCDCIRGSGSKVTKAIRG